MMDASVFGYGETFRLLQLQGIVRDICNVYMMICNSGKKMPNDENAIRDTFGKYLQCDTYKETSTDTVRFYQVDTEIREGTHGRTDIRFLKVKEYEGQQVYYTVECKRLDGTGRLCKEYADNGIRRFTTGKYSTPLGCNAMMGFVVCAIDLTATIDKVNGHLTASENLKTQYTEMAPMISLESLHQTPQRFVLYHLWTDFSNLVE